MQSKVYIPSNTSNCISKISQLQLTSTKTALYLGSIHATEHSVLKQYRIRAILTVGSGLEVTPPAGVAHQVIDIEDYPNQNIAQHFSLCNNFIKEQLQKGNVLVHCRAGMSRSASVVLAYTMKTKKLRLSKAMETVRQARNIVNPNPGFLNQLKDYERKLSKVLQAKNLRLK